MRIATTAASLVFVLVVDFLPLRILFGYWGLVFGLSLLTWWNMHAMIDDDALTIRGFQRTRIPWSNVLSVEERPFGARASLAPLEPMRRVNQSMLKAGAAYSKSSGANVTLRRRKKEWYFFFFPIPFAIRGDKVELALEEPSEFVQAVQQRLDGLKKAPSAGNGGNSGLRRL